ncbi:MAG: BMP family ABC transporter substrate-binding protein [Clostridiales Family XIII bacterium]|jgi:basic membrane protein A|nr:BMP family ABC transporter substrate-binding protein [Clostridiales Family XIII bacterium]
MKKRVLVLLLAFAMVFAFSACGEKKADTDDKDEVLKIGFIYIGSINDKGYTETQHNGTVALQEHFADEVECLWEENIEESTQAVQDSATRLIDNGCTVIVGTSYGFGTPLFEMANSGDYDDVTFLHFSGSDINDTNFGNYFGAMEEPRFLSGVIAGLQTTSNKLGYVAAFDNMEVNIGINAFTLGARSVNPDAQVIVTYTKSWYDPSGEKSAAEALLAQGCDVITQHADTSGPQLAAADAKKFAIGYNLDNSGLEGLEDAYLTAPVWHHDAYLISVVETIKDGTWKPESYYGTMADGYISLAPLTKNVTDEAKAKVEALEKEIKDGTLKIFVGPIKDNQGNVMVEEGETLDRAGIWEVNGVLVEGATATNSGK